MWSYKLSRLKASKGMTFFQAADQKLWHVVSCHQLKEWKFRIYELVCIIVNSGT